MNGLDGRLAAAVTTTVLLLVPLVFAALPASGWAALPLSRLGTITLFFLLVPAGFAVLASYKVLDYYGTFGGETDSE